MPDEKSPRGPGRETPPPARKREAPPPKEARPNVGTEAPPEPPVNGTGGKGPATEDPIIVGAGLTTSQYVVTVDNRTGLSVKIERLDEKTSQRRELTEEEYAYIYPSGRPGKKRGQKKSATPLFSGATLTPEQTALMEAYYRGVADYIRAIT